MIGFVLAAGFGTRLKPLTDDIPKAMVSVCGVPLLQRNINFFSSGGIERIGVNAHYLPDQIYSFREKSSVPFDIFHEQGKIRGTGGALFFARSFLSSDEQFCVANADILSNVDLVELATKFQQSDSICALIAAPSPGSGTIRYDPETFEYCGIPSGDSLEGMSAGAEFIGMAFYKREILNIVTDSDFSVIPIWKRAQENGFSVKVFITPDIFWLDTGTPIALANIHFDLLDSRVDLFIPEHIHVDYKKKIAYPETLPKESAASLHEYCWSDSLSIAPNAAVTRSVLFQGAVVKERETVSNVLLTKRGGIPFESTKRDC